MAALILYVNSAPGIKYELDKNRITIGRDIDNDICLDDPCVSKQHAVIEIKTLSLLDETHEYHLIDLDSTNACLVNNQSATHALLAHGDYVRIGNHLFKFTAEAKRPVEKDANRTRAVTAASQREVSRLRTKAQLANASGADEFDMKFSRRLRTF